MDFFNSLLGANLCLMKASSTSLALSPALKARIEAAAAEENRPVGEMLGDAVDHYLLMRQIRIDEDQALRTARALGFSEGTGESTPEYRATMRQRIDAGIESLRQGNLVDGDAVFARIDAELSALERGGRG